MLTFVFCWTITFVFCWTTTFIFYWTITFVFCRVVAAAEEDAGVEAVMAVVEEEISVELR